MQTPVTRSNKNKVQTNLPEGTTVGKHYNAKAYRERRVKFECILRHQNQVPLVRRFYGIQSNY
jgi:hypothetical protein